LASLLLAGAVPQAQATDVTTLKLYFWDETFTDVTQQTIAAFEAQNPDIKIEATCLPWAQYWVKIPALISSGSDLDLFWANVLNGVEFINKDLLLPLDGTRINAAGFTQPTIGPFTGTQGTLYGVPIFYDCSGLMYNKALFDKAGVPYPTDDWTWEDMREAAKKLTVRDENGEAQQWGIYLDSASDTWNIFYTFVYESGSDIFAADGKSAAFNNEKAAQAMRFVYDMVYADRSSPDTQEVQELGVTELFTSGKVAMIFHTTPFFTTMYEAMRDQVDAVQRPAGAREGTPLSAIGYVASKNTKHPEAVQKFMDFLATDAPNDIMAQKNTPALPSATEKWAAAFPGSNTAAWIAPLSSGTGFPCPYVYQANSEVWSLVATELNYMMSGQKPIEQGLADLAAQVNALQQ
jgi:multiple sugar transport system substrate-binding protein